MPRTVIKLLKPLNIAVSALARATSLRYIGPEASFPDCEMIGSTNNEKPIFLGFAKKDDNGFHEIISDYSGEEIGAMIQKNAAEIPEELRTALADTPLQRQFLMVLGESFMFF